MSWGVAQKQRLAGNDEIDKTVLIKWALKRITESSNSSTQRLELYLLIDKRYVREHSCREHSLITEEPFRRSENDSGVVYGVCAIQSQGINKFINSRTGFFESLSIGISTLSPTIFRT